MRLGYKLTDVGVIPKDWEIRPVAAMGEVRAGKALAARGPGQQRPYLRTKNVFDGRIDLNDVLRMPMTEDEFSRYRLQHGDVLLNEGQSLELVGRCAMYQDEYLEPCAIQNQLLRFRARRGVSPRFAAQLFRHCQRSGVFTKIALQTTSVAHLGVSRFQGLQLAWPANVVEQEAIADALSEADARVESLELFIAKKRLVMQGAMQELLSGKRRLPGFGGAWGVKPFDEVLSRLNARSHQIQASAYQAAGRYPVVDQGQEAIIGYSDDTSKVFRCPPGGVIVFGDHTCIAKFVAFDFIVGAEGTQVLEAIAGQSCRFHAYRLQMSGITPTGYNRHFRILREQSFASPGFEEQTAIAKTLSDVDAEIASLSAEIDKARLLKLGMMQSLLSGRIRLN